MNPASSNGKEKGSGEMGAAFEKGEAGGDVRGLLARFEGMGFSVV